jgi:hypothetical protein
MHDEDTRIPTADDPPPDAQVDIGDRAAVQRWSRRLGVTDEALIGAVQAVGPRVDRVQDYLGAGGMAADQEGG